MTSALWATPDESEGSRAPAAWYKFSTMPRAVSCRFLILILIPIVSALALLAPAARAADSASVRLHALLERAWQSKLDEHPEFATYIGFPGHNSLWTDYSPAGIARREASTREQLAAVFKFHSVFAGLRFLGLFAFGFCPCQSLCHGIGTRRLFLSFFLALVFFFGHANQSQIPALVTQTCVIAFRLFNWIDRSQAVVPGLAPDELRFSFFEKCTGAFFHIVG